jgi:SMP-30/gluconolaconase/LRE-like protein
MSLLPPFSRSLFTVTALTIAFASCGSPEPAQPPPATEQTPPGAPAPPPASAGWTVEGMLAPESAYLDEGSGYLYVSQIDGQPNEKDGKGRISKLGLDGTLVAADWVTGLNAPKGLRSFGGTLWVADLDEVVGVEIASAKITSRIKVEGAKFLNDVACGADGTVYVSDMMLSRIYAIKDGKVSVFAEGEDLEYPNGLLVDGERLVVASWGKPEADFSTKVPGRLYTLDLKTKRKTLITKQPTGNLDGLDQDARGGYIVTDWIAGKVLQITASGETRLVRQFKPGTADHTFLYAQGDILILPQMNENKVAAYDISADVK